MDNFLLVISHSPHISSVSLSLTHTHEYEKLLPGKLLRNHLLPNDLLSSDLLSGDLLSGDILSGDLLPILPFDELLTDGRITTTAPLRRPLRRRRRPFFEFRKKYP
jgi:hypothetical protein